jgi:hypothetical protein
MEETLLCQKFWLQNQINAVAASYVLFTAQLLILRHTNLQGQEYLYIAINLQVSLSSALSAVYVWLLAQ